MQGGEYLQHLSGSKEMASVDRITSTDGSGDGPDPYPSHLKRPRGKQKIKGRAVDASPPLLPTPLWLLPFSPLRELCFTFFSLSDSSSFSFSVPPHIFNQPLMPLSSVSSEDGDKEIEKPKRGVGWSQSMPGDIIPLTGQKVCIIIITSR